MKPNPHLWYAALLLSLAAPLHGETQIRKARADGVLLWRCGSSPSTPARTVVRLYRAIEANGTAALSWFLAEDFRFVSDDPSFLESWPNGMDRSAELNFVRRLHASVREVRITHEEIVVEPSVPPMCAASGTYQVRVKGAALRFRDVSQGEIAAQSREHVFEVVCVPIPATEGRVSRCRVRRWTEYSAAAAPAAIDPPDTSSPAASAQTDEAPAILDLRVLSNGRRDVPSFSVSLPGPSPARLEMFDVAGRRVDSRELSDLTRGIHPVGIPAQLANGVYWARLYQGTAMKTARVVILR